MDYDSLMAELETLGTEQNRKIYRRHGARDPLFGLSFAHLKQLKKKLKTDHDLARHLWASGNHDARILATMIADPAKTDPELLDAWSRDLDSYPLVDAFATLAARTPAAWQAVDRWIVDPGEWIASAGWRLLATLATLNQTPEDPAGADWEGWLARIERDLQKGANRVRHTMNGALIAIGARDDALAAKATAAAQRIGKVVVDHGQTDCKTPEAGAYIQKAREHRKRKG